MNMRKFLNQSLAAVIVLTLALSVFASKVHALDPVEIDLNQEVCAAVFPCLENGEIIPQFDSPGYCGNQYRILCASVKTSLMSDDLISCQNENIKFKTSEAKLTKKIRSLRKKLRDNSN